MGDTERNFDSHGNHGYRSGFVRIIKHISYDCIIAGILFEESITADKFSGFEVMKHLDAFKREHNVISLPQLFDGDKFNNDLFANISKIINV